MNTHSKIEQRVERAMTELEKPISTTPTPQFRNRVLERLEYEQLQPEAPVFHLQSMLRYAAVVLMIALNVAVYVSFSATGSGDSSSTIYGVYEAFVPEYASLFED
ncbi:MAG: hypothetical protein AAFW89_12035 [Bacteroidota bacterium]